MSSKMLWRVVVTNMQTQMRVGIHPQEQNPQRILVNAIIEGYYPLPPQSIDDCFNYEHVHQLVVAQWPSRPHTKLLETLVLELLAHIFKSDTRVTNAKVNIAKPDIFSETESVGVEAEWTRAHYEQFKASL